MVDNRLSREPTSSGEEAPSSLEELRDAVASRLRKTESELLQLIARFSPPAPELPEIEPPRDVAPATAPLSVLRGAAYRLDGASDHAELLVRLLEESTAFASRAALLIGSDGGNLADGGAQQGLQIWSAVGFDQDRTSEPLVPPRAWAGALGGQESLVFDAAGGGTVSALLGGEQAQRAVVVPLCLRERVAGVLYADDLGGEASFEPAGLQLLVHTAALALELLVRREQLPAATLSEPREAGPEASLEPDREAAPPPPEPAPPTAETLPAAEAPEPEEPAEAVTEPAAGRAPTFDADEYVEVDETPSWQGEPIPEISSPATVQPAESQPTPAAEQPSSTAGFQFDEETAQEETARDQTPRDETPRDETTEEIATDPFSALSEPEPPAASRPGLELLRGTEGAAETSESAATGEGLEPSVDPSLVEPVPPAIPSDEPAEEIGLRTQALDTSAFLEAQPVPEPEPPPAEPDTQPGSEVTTGSLVVPPTDVEGPGWAFSEREAIGDDPQHEEAKRLARLLVSEIKLYNEEQIEEGRRQGNIYDQLKEDIDRSRKMYEERVDERIRAASDYFREELIRSLADGDAQVMGL